MPRTADLFALLFVVGIALAVFVLIRGVERRGAPAGSALHSSRIALQATATASFLATFGLVGYVGSRSRSPRLLPIVASAAALAVAGAIVATLLVRRWARHAAEEEASRAPSELQGYPATVLRERDEMRDAEVGYWHNGRFVTSPARSTGQDSLRVGTDVVIERVEADVVYVESWSQVEQRI